MSQNFRLICKVFFLLLFAGLYTTNVNSQGDFRQGYIITLDNDTSYGLINYNGKLNQECEFKKAGSEDVIRYTPFIIEGFRFINDKYFVSKAVTIKNSYVKIVNKTGHLDNVTTTSEYETEGTTGQRVFLEYLVEGELNLFYLHDENDIDHYFLEKSDSVMTDLAIEQVKFYVNTVLNSESTNNLYKGKIKAIMQDCPQLKQKIESTGLVHKDMINITQQYNQYTCPDKKCILYTKALGPTKFIVGIHAGISYTNSTNFYYYYGTPNNYFELDPAFGPNLGTEFIFSNLFHRFEKMSLVINADISRFSYEKEFKFYSNHLIPSQFKMVSNIIATSVLSRNRFTSRRNSLFFEYGVVTRMRFNSYTGDEKNFVLNDDNYINYGITASLGYEANLFFNHKMYAKAVIQQLIHEYYGNFIIGFIF